MEKILPYVRIKKISILNLGVNMSKNFGSFSPKVKRILHGGDYNPDQWQHRPDILKEDLRLMKLAKVNSASINIFGWAAVEPEEGKFTFEWLDKIMDDLAKIGSQVVLATPSGAKPNWLALKYPEVRRVNRDGSRQPQHGRHNNCFNSPVYREKTALINQKLAERYRNHPALALWHISNEFNGGECHCNYCYANFRKWLKDRYKTLDALNEAWWSHFWASTYTSWDQIEPVDPENLSLELDWKRFISASCVEFFKSEIAPLKKITPQIPVTTNFMGFYDGLNYWKLAEAEDVVSWDSYPNWHAGDDAEEAMATAFAHDFNRSMKGGKPFILMESTPEGTNWREASKLKKPGMHLASSLQAMAHGSDTVMYFQWRKGRGNFEKFHGAVVDHEGSEHTRTFQAVAELGAALEKLTPILGTGVDAEVALLFDTENRWALNLSKGPRNTHKDHDGDCQEHYREFWRRGIPVDLVNLESDISKYKVLVAPMMYMLTESFARKIEAFVKQGGTLVTTYHSAVVNENDLCYLGGRPGPIRKVLGIWAEELDVLVDQDKQSVKAVTGNALGLKGSYAARHYADIVHLEGAKALAQYGEDFYAKSPALTVNAYGKGKGYYICSRNDRKFLSDFYEGLIKTARLRHPLKTAIPDGVEVCERSDENNRFLFITNFRNAPRSLSLAGIKGVDMLNGKKTGASLKLGAFGCVVLKV